jgi:carboxymethylenebutenolidase
MPTWHCRRPAPAPGCCCIRSVAEQYALHGFVVLAPDVFWQQQPRLDIGYTPEDIQRGRALAMATDRSALVRDLVDAAKDLRARPDVLGRGIGAIGYCMGGRLAYVAAATAGIDAAVAYYGGGIHDMLELAPQIRCPVQFHYGALDANIPLSAVDQVRAAMQGRNAQVHVYDSADHGFNCWARGSYQAASAALAHGRTLQFLAEQLF